MKEHYVSYEQSVKLKELGFDEPCENVYSQRLPNHESFSKRDDAVRYFQLTGNSLFTETLYSAPRLDQAQAWLRELGALHINVYPAIPFNKWKFNLDDLGQSVNPTNGELNCRITEEMTEKFEDGWYDTYEYALSAGISKAIELLGKEVNNA